MLQFGDALFEVGLLGFKDGDGGTFGKALGEKDSSTDKASCGNDGENNGGGDKVVFDEGLISAAD